MNKRGDFSNLIFLILVLIVCTYTLVSFLKSNGEIEENFNDLKILRAINSEIHILESEYDVNANNVFVMSYTNYLEVNSFELELEEVRFKFLDFNGDKEFSEILKNNLISLSGEQKSLALLKKSDTLESQDSISIFVSDFIKESLAVDSPIKQKLSGSVYFTLNSTFDLEKEFYLLENIENFYLECKPVNDISMCLEDKMKNFKVDQLSIGKARYLEFYSKEEYLFNNEFKKIHFMVLLN